MIIATLIAAIINWRYRATSVKISRSNMNIPAYRRMISGRLQHFLFHSRSKTTVKAFLLVGIAVLSAATILVFGADPGGDSDRYINRGARLWEFIAHGHSTQPLAEPWNLLYLLPNLYISALVQWTYEYAAVISVAGNIVAYGAFVLYVCRTWVRTSPLEANFLVVTASLAMFFGLPGEVTKYLGLYHGSDILFLSLCGVTLGTLARSELLGCPRLAGAALLLGVLCMFTRPPGIVTFLVVLSAVSLKSIYLSRQFIALAVLLPIFVAVVAWPYYIDYLVDTKSAISEGMVYVVENFQLGAVVSGYKRSYMVEPEGFLDYMRIILLRMGYYLVPLRLDYSPTHLLYNLFYLFAFVFLFIRGYQHLWRCGQPGRRLLVTLGLYLLWMVLFHGMTQVEDWRYEMPIWAALWLVAGYGFCPPVPAASSQNPASPRNSY